MTEISEIKDTNSLRAWLEEQDSYEVSVSIAARAALRVQPLLWPYLSPARQDADSTALVFVRSGLISAIAAVCLTADIKLRAAYAADAAADAARVARAAADAARAADAAADTARAAAYARAAAAAYAADAAADAAGAAAFSADAAAGLWNEIRTDAELLSRGADILRTPLWTSDAPQFLAWDDIGRSWRSAGAPWDFFADWYDGLLKGREPDWPLLEQIALIAPEDWEDDKHPDGEKAPAKIARRIEEITEELAKPPAPAKPDPQIIRQNAGANSETLPAQMEALLLLIENENERLRGKNPVDEIEVEDIRRLRELFESMHGTLVAIARVLPEQGPPSEAEAKDVASLLSVYAAEFAKWPRENAADMVDGTCRMALVGLTAGLFTAFGVPILAGVAAGGVVFGGKRIADIRAAAKEAGASTAP